MKIIKRSSRLLPVVLLLSPVAPLLSPVALSLSSLAALGLCSPAIIASELPGASAAVVDEPSDASTEEFIGETAEGVTEEFSDDMLDFILSSDAEILQAIEHRPLLDMLDAGDTAGMGNKTGDRTGRANPPVAAGRQGG